MGSKVSKYCIHKKETCSRETHHHSHVPEEHSPELRLWIEAGAMVYGGVDHVFVCCDVLINCLPCTTNSPPWD